MMENQIVVRMCHVRQANLCAKGVRQWFLAEGFPWSDFLAHGKSVDELEATGNPVAQQVAAIARQEAVDGRRG